MSRSHSLPNEMVFSPPDAKKLEEAGAVYAVRNYCGNGLVARFKRRRFSKALKMAKNCRSARVIDMGCCDGVLIPTLAAHFEQVVAIDYNSVFVERCKRLTSGLGLENVTCLCNKDVDFDAIREQIGPDYGLMFTLETLEHVGRQPGMWESKREFLINCFRLLDPAPQSRIIVSVPKMVGWGFMLKHGVQWFRGVKDDQMPLLDFLRSGLLKNTDNLESRWDGGHVGFNHLKLEAMMRQSFKIWNTVEDPFSAIYEIGRI